MGKQVQKPKITVASQGKIQAKVAKKSVIWEFPLERKNFIWILAGILAVVLGYVLMATGITEQPALTSGKWNNVFAVDIAPFLLVIGYCVLIPYGILKLFRKKEEVNQ